MNLRLYILLYLIVILVLVFYNYEKPKRERMEGDSINKDVVIPQDDPDFNSSNTELNIFERRDAQMKRLRERLTSSHELPEQTFDDITKKRSDDTTFDDELFKTAKYYEFKEGEKTGIQQCIEDCDGNCLEYGYTGFAWCFPKIKR